MLEEYPSPKGETMCPEEDDDGDKDDPRSMGLPIADELGDNELLGPAARLWETGETTLINGDEPMLTGLWCCCVCGDDEPSCAGGIGGAAIRPGEMGGYHEPNDMFRWGEARKSEPSGWFGIPEKVRVGSA
jgi:hypothetical protein